MKKIIAVIIAVALITTMFIACSKQSDTTDAEGNDIVTEVVTDENGETVTEVVTDENGETVTETVTKKVTTADGTVETVTKTVPVTEAVTRITTTNKSTTKKTGDSSSGSSSSNNKSSGGTSSNNTTTKKNTTTSKPTTTKRPSTTKPAATKPSTTKPAATKPATTKPTTTVHTHNWVAQTKTETTYEWENHVFCNGCGMDLTEESRKLGMNYALFQMKHCRGDGVTPCPETLGECGEAHHEQVKVATGTKTVITGYKCPTCGATKSA